MATANVNELWRECADWLTRCDVLRSDHKANWPEANIHDLAYTLRDGVLLCNLLKQLDPGCIDFRDVNQKPQMAQFLCLQNIKIFLQTCHDVFGIKEADLFDPSMLFDLTNFHRVLCTLAKLSTCPHVQKKNITGFSAHRTQSQEDIYNDLRTIGNTQDRDLIDEPYGSYYSHIKNEEIYQGLCSVSYRSSNTTSQFGHINSHNLEKRDYVIKELVDTETNYVEVLGKLQKHFMKPLSSCLPANDVKIIFKGIKELSEIHSGFLSQLRKACYSDNNLTSGTNQVRLSEVFINWREKFLIYGDYCANLTRAQSQLQELCDRNELFNQEVIKCEMEANNGKFKLRDILSVPMQRILKYHLLLDKLISETQPNHEDYRELKRAREAMVDVAQYINEVKRDSDTLQLLRQIQENIVDWDIPGGMELHHYGRLICDGDLKIKGHDDQKIRVRYVFIFDQILLMCKPLKGNQFSYRETLKLSEYRIEDHTGRRTLNRDARWSYQWLLVRKTQQSAYTLYARTEDLKIKMIKALKDAMDNIEPAACRNTDHKFVMYTFTKPVSCVYCSKWLKGRIFQGYKCTTCDTAVHKACIPNAGRCGHPPPPPPPSHYPDRGLSEYLWFAGEMRREVATMRLDKRIDGTYMLRIRPQGPTHPNETPYALSLKTDCKVKHMKVYKKDVESVAHYFLSESRFFKSIVELIGYYEQTSLVENFVGLDVVLQWPYRRIKAIAECDFNPTDPAQLKLRRGWEIIVLSKDRESQGWWRGKYQNKVGFFPKAYVRVEPELFTQECE
ncbi:protein vav isoform X1 [Chrysoperla carnea]|uniref:protein vav isoform X1 n=1 Tax=Chrysoperla carnea TaxID=189513 RepID=UPI001D096390|nr:protein vav isoform X1 [Chrysoperla carnea]